MERPASNGCSRLFRAITQRTPASDRAALRLSGELCVGLSGELCVGLSGELCVGLSGELCVGLSGELCVGLHSDQVPASALTTDVSVLGAEGEGRDTYGTVLDGSKTSGIYAASNRERYHHPNWYDHGRRHRGGGAGGQVPRYRKLAGYSTPLSSVRLEARSVIHNHS